MTQVHTGSPRDRVLAIDNVSIAFGDTLALDSVSVHVDRGEILGLLGANGSGKSTLIKVLAGYHQASSGTARAADQDDVVQLDERREGADDLGIRFIHQDLGLIDSLTVLENLIGPDVCTGRGARVRWREWRRRSAQLLADHGIGDLDLDAAVESLSLGTCARLAIVRAVSQGVPRVLVLDEPTVFLSATECRELFALLHRLTSQGTGVVLVSHDLDEVRTHCDRLIVLRDGRRAGELSTSDCTEQAIIDLMFGSVTLEQHAKASTTPRGKPLLKVTGLTGEVLRETDLLAHSGEILGLTGLAGSGYEEVPYLLYGATKARSGSLSIDGRPVKLGSFKPARAIAHNAILIPGDRKADGLVLGLSLNDNLSLAVLRRHSTMGRLRWRSLRQASAAVLSRFGVKASSSEALAETLSGGNQQRALLGKWLQTAPQVILLDEPAQGVDVAARADIFRIIRAAANDGAAVVCASSDHSQLADLCDRVVVFREGRPVCVIEGEDLRANRLHEASASSDGDKDILERVGNT